MDFQGFNLPLRENTGALRNAVLAERMGMLMLSQLPWRNEGEDFKHAPLVAVEARGPIRPAEAGRPGVHDPEKIPAAVGG